MAYDKFKGRTQSACKTKTNILLSDRNEVSNFGNNAKASYLNLQSTEQKTWKYFERFKMKLYDGNMHNNVDEEKKVSDKVDTADTLKAVNGQILAAEIVFVQAFKSLQKLAKACIPRITKNKARVTDDEIQWILTVPAIWSDSAKQKMKRWITNAGLVDKNIKDQCVIVYEPDCASLAIQREHLKGRIINDDYKDSAEMPIMQNGNTYILVDAGGGTVDIATHKILEDGSVEEIMRPTGGKLGSCYIDDLYIKLLEEIFSEAWMDEFKKEGPLYYMEIRSNFEKAKETFYEDSESMTHPVELPFEFVQFLEEKCDAENTTPQTMINEYSKSVTLREYHIIFGASYSMKVHGAENDYANSSYKRQNEICKLEMLVWNNEEYIDMDVKIWTAMFDSKIDEIIHIVKNKLLKCLKTRCDYLCLVGGFTGSLYYQLRMKNEFAKEMLLIVPEKPILAVVIGAAWMGITKNYVKGRKLRHTYGIKMAFPKKQAKESGISQEYIKNNMDADGLINGCFNIIACKGTKDECLQLHSIKKEVTYAPGKTIEILCSNKMHPKTKEDGFLLATFKMPHFNDDKGIILEFYFYATTFKVQAYAKSAPSERKAVEIYYVDPDFERKAVAVTYQQSIDNIVFQSKLNEVCKKKPNISFNDNDYKQEIVGHINLNRVLAVLIFVGEYYNLRNLPGTQTDKKRIFDLLHDKYKYDVIANKRSKVTKDDMDDILHEAKKKFRKKENEYQAIMIFFSGHGNSEWLLLSDFVNNNNYQGKYARKEFELFFSGSKVMEKIKECKFYFIDSCRGDTLSKVYEQEALKINQNIAALVGTKSGSYVQGTENISLLYSNSDSLESYEVPYDKGKYDVYHLTKDNYMSLNGKSKCGVFMNAVCRAFYYNAHNGFGMNYSEIEGNIMRKTKNTVVPLDGNFRTKIGQVVWSRGSVYTDLKSGIVFGQSSKNGIVHWCC
eukprot:269282_1